MPYAAPIEALLGELSRKAKAKADALATSRTECRHGLLSVGLKVHCLQDGGFFNELIARLGGSEVVLDRNIYRAATSSWCLVLPPVGNAEAAIQLVECLEQYTGVSIFGNSDYQLQVCTPGRLDNMRSALVAIVFYLASDTIRTYKMADLDTTVSDDRLYSRGQRLVIYDANNASSEFDRRFEWWHKRTLLQTLQIWKKLPFKKSKRTDVLLGTASSDDIRNVNLAASLLVHAQFDSFGGWWHDLGVQFEQEVLNLLQEHQLRGIVDAQWVTPPGARMSTQDEAFYSALSELVSYAFNENRRLRQHLEFYLKLKQPPGPVDPGIFYEIDSILQKYYEHMSEVRHGEQA